MVKRNRIITKTRRANNEGSIYQRKDGRWAGTATVGYNNDGKIIRKTVYGKTRMEVTKKMTELTKRIESNNFDYVENHNLSELMNEWLFIFKKIQVTPRTFENNLIKFKKYIEPKIGNMKLQEISSLTIQKMLNEMLEENLSLDYVKKTKFLLRQFFEYAVDNQFMLANPIQKVKIKSKERKIYDSENKYKAIPQEIREYFIDCLNNHKFLKPLCFVMMFAGLRTGEALALNWENIDFNKKTISVEKAITTIPKFDKNGKITERVTVISDTKTSCSVRTVPMPEILISALKDYKVEQELNGDLHNINLIDKKSLVFANKDGSIRTYTGTKKIFYRFLKKYGLDKYGIHFHTLRHTYSNMLFGADQNPKVIQALLGHKSVETTITIYNSVDKSYFQKATDVINNQYNTSKNTDKNNDFKQELDEDELEEYLQWKKEREKQKRHKDFEM